MLFVRRINRFHLILNMNILINRFITSRLCIFKNFNEYTFENNSSANDPLRQLIIMTLLLCVSFRQSLQILLYQSLLSVMLRFHVLFHLLLPKIFLTSKCINFDERLVIKEKKTIGFLLFINIVSCMVQDCIF